MSTLFYRLRRYAIIVVLSIPVMAGAFVWQHPAILTAAKLFEVVLRTISKEYVDSIPMDSLYLRAARGLVYEFHDPYTELYTPAEWTKAENSLNGNIAGIGVGIQTTPTGVYLGMVYPGSPAASGGLHIGDQVIQADTTRFGPGLTMQTSGHIAGPVGTSVHLAVVREAVGSSRLDTLQLTLTRARVNLPVVPFTLLLDGHVGYIPMRAFGSGATKQVRAALDTLRRAGATKFILDLRGNPGGFVNEATTLCGLFLPPEKAVVRMRGRGGEEVYTTPSEPPIAPSEPLVVLVNPGTGSAAEITSGALQDYDRAVVIGQRTYGKGVGQNSPPMPDGYVLKLTTQRWYTPLGRSVQRERTLLPSGEYVEVHPESLETAADRLARPTYKSDAGRTLYGGGGIVPDFVVHDTLGAGGALFFAAIKSNMWPMQSVLSSYASSIVQAKSKQTHVTPAMRAIFFHRLQMAGIVLPHNVVTKAGPFVDRLIAERIALIHGDLMMVKRVGMDNDVPLTLALETLQHVTDQTSLFAAVRKHEQETR